MRDYVQKHVRENLVKGKEIFRAAVRGIQPKLFQNISPYGPADEHLQDCSVYGNVHLGNNSRLIGCIIGPHVTLWIGDDTVITDSIFLSETTHCNSHRLDSISCGNAVEVVIGDRCAIHYMITCTDVELGSDSCVYSSFFRRTIKYGKPSERVPMKIGDNAVISESVLDWTINEGGDVELKQFSIGDNAIIVDRALQVLSSDIKIGNNLLLGSYNKALSDMCDSVGVYPREFTEVPTTPVDYTVVRDRFSSAGRYCVRFGKYDRVRIGDGCFISISMDMAPIQGVETYIDIGNENNLVSPDLEVADRYTTTCDYKRFMARFKTGDQDTLVLLPASRGRTPTRSPIEVTVKDKLNLIIYWSYEACPCTDVQIQTDGRYSI